MFAGMTLRIVGRSSSHFTRTVRLFAHELEIEHAFAPLADLSSRNVQDYAGNPALKIPILETPEGPWYGALNICRELARRAPSAPKQIVWPEQLRDHKAANAQELVLSGMATEVALIMGGEIATDSKAFESLTNSLRWLDVNWPDVRPAASTDALSILELTAFCFVTHLGFRNVADVTPYPALQAFCAEYGERAAARATSYRFDFSS